MTDDEYQKLLLYCRNKNNKDKPEYKDRFVLKCIASDLRRSITKYRTLIKEKTRVLEMCKDERKIEKYLKEINEFRDAKIIIIKQFRSLKF